MQEPVIKLGSKTDFLQFLNKVHKHDQATLRVYFKVASKKKQLLLLCRRGPAYSQIFIVPLDVLPTIQNKINMRFAVGFSGVQVPQNTYYVWGDMIQDQEEVGQFHVEEAENLVEQEVKNQESKKEEIKPKKRRYNKRVRKTAHV